MAGTAGASCDAGPSAAHARRAPAWCRGAFSADALGSSAGGDVCMLTPVHAPNFQHLSRRLEQTALLSIGPVPTTVAVFDDPPASREFCRRFERACATPGYVPLDLKTLLGDAYARAEGMLRTGNSARRERLRNEAHGANPLARECFPKFGGQCYQSLKKFYAAADGPAHCRVYWVSDAESYPFRPFNFSALVSRTVRRPLDQALGQPRSASKTPEHRAWTNGAAAAAPHGRPFMLIPSWYPDRYGCTATTNAYDDGDCAVWIADSLALGAPLRLGGAPELELSSGGGGGGSYLTSSRRAYQTVYDLNNWWFYDRVLARAIIDRTEEVRRVHFVTYFASLQVPDINFWRTNFEFLARRTCFCRTPNSAFAQTTPASFRSLPRRAGFTNGGA